MQVNRIGVDVSASELVCFSQQDQIQRSATFENTEAGHQRFIQWALANAQAAQVCVESTGIYSFAFSLAVQRAERIEIMVVNPRAIKDFARACMRRAKTDAVDAQIICLFLQRMPFHPWQPPSNEVLQLQALSRRVQQLKTEMTRERNRLHASEFAEKFSDVIAHDIDLNIRHLERRILKLEEAAIALIQQTPTLLKAYTHLISVRGIGDTSAIRLLAELLVLPEDMKAPQWVAHAGLDPRPYESGSAVNKPRRITKVGNAYLRHALYMPALVASRQEPQVQAFYQHLIQAGKKPKQALVAIMRKLLHAIWGMFKHNQNFDGQKFYQSPKTA